MLIDGLGFEILKSNLLLNVFQKKDLSDEDKEHVTIYIRNQRIKFNQAFINKANIPEIYKDKFNFKLCIDTYDDFINMKDAWSTITNYKNIDIGDTRQIILNMISKSKL